MDVPTFILGTDYENWAVVYYCKQQQVLKFGKETRENKFTF